MLHQRKWQTGAVVSATAEAASDLTAAVVSATAEVGLTSVVVSSLTIAASAGSTTSTTSARVVLVVSGLVNSGFTTVLFFEVFGFKTLIFCFAAAAFTTCFIF